jgi:glycosyltransferase involved in cell wall biosynthesis
MPLRRVVHTITPGDHFSPRTGSAIPTVVHGLTGAALAGGDDRQAVVLDRSTYRPRYDSADLIEYDGASAPTRAGRYRDLAAGRIGMPRSAIGSYYAPIAEAVRPLPPAIVLAHNAPVLAWLLRESGHRVVLYAHNELLRTYSRREAGRMLGGAAAIVCVSDSLAERTRERLPTSLHPRVHVVPNAVDTERFRPASASSPSAGPLRVVYVGRIIREKGVDVLARAAARFAADDIEFLIVGSHGFDPTAPLSSYEQELRALAARSAAPVRFEPFADRMRLPDILRAADVLVVPSRWPEPSGLTVGEGLATGLPVIASRVGGIPEVLGDAGVLVDPDDDAALAAQLRRLIDQPELRRTLSAAARQRAEQRDWAWSWGILRNVLSGL